MKKYDDPTPLNPVFVAIVGVEMVVYAFYILASLTLISESLLLFIGIIVTLLFAEYGLWRILCLDKKGVLIFFIFLILNVCVSLLNRNADQEALMLLHLIAFVFILLLMFLKSDGLSVYQLLWGNHANHLIGRYPSMRSLFYNPSMESDEVRFSKFRNIFFLILAVVLSLLIAIMLTGTYNKMAQSITGQWYLHNSTRVVITFIITVLDFAVAHLTLRPTMFGKSKAFNIMTAVLIFLWCVLVGLLFMPD